MKSSSYVECIRSRQYGNKCLRDERVTLTGHAPPNMSSVYGTVQGLEMGLVSSVYGTATVQGLDFG
jgi:hypothetical protein